MPTLWWNNNDGDNDATLRRNYSEVQSGIPPAASDFEYQEWRFTLVAAPDGTSAPDSTLAVGDFLFISGINTLHTHSLGDTLEEDTPVVIDTGTPVFIDTISLTSVSGTGRAILVEGWNGSTWDSVGLYQSLSGPISTLPLSRVSLLDDLRFDGTGGKASDPWTVGAAQTLTCNSLNMTGWESTSRVATVSATGTVTVTGELVMRGSVTGWVGATTAATIDVSSNTDWANGSNRCAVTLTGATLSRTLTGAARVSFIDLTLTQTTDFDAAGSNITINGSIVGGQRINKVGSNAMTFQLSGLGRTSEVGSVWLYGGLTFIADTNTNATTIRGIGGAGNEPSECPIHIAGNGVTLRYGSNLDNTDMLWGNPLVVEAAVTGASLRFEGIGPNRTTRHFCYFPFTLGSDLTVTRAESISPTVTVRGPTDWTGTGTLDPDAGKIMGVGKLTVERPSGLAQNFFFHVLYDTGARVEHTGGTLITSPTQSYRADFGYRNVPPGETVSLGTGEIEVNRNATLLTQGIATGAPFIVTNDIRCTGDFTGSDHVPTLFIGRSGAGNPTVNFTGMLTIDCPEIYCTTGAGGGGQQHTFLGGITLTQDTQIWFVGSNSQDFVIGSDITGAFELKLLAANIGGEIKFAYSQSVPRKYTILSGSGFVEISSLEALKTATEIEVLSGGRLLWSPVGSVVLDGVLNLRAGSIVSYISGSLLRLNSVGPHEWSCTLVDETAARDSEIIVPFDNTVLSFNAGPSLTIPNLRMLGNTTLTTSQPTSIVIRVGQAQSGILPSGVPTTFLSRGSSLTINANVILSLYKSDGQPLGTSGIATITGDGLLVFTQENGWSPPPTYTQALFDINVGFAGATSPGTTLTVEGFNFGKDVRTENDSVNLTMIFDGVNIGGDFYTFMPANGAGNQVIIWTGVSVIEGDFYQRKTSDNGQGSHRHNFGGTTRIKGDFRPGSAKVGGPGANSTYTMNVYLAAFSTVILEGDWFTRVAGYYPFIPLDNFAQLNPGTVVIDLTEKDVSLNLEYAGIPANVKVDNSSGITRTYTVGASNNHDYWYHSLTITGDNINLDMSGALMTVGNFSCSGDDCTLIMAPYVQIFPFSWLYSQMASDATFDLRGFASVDGSALETFDSLPEPGGNTFYLDGLQALNAILRFSVSSTEGVSTFKDAATFGNLVSRAGAGRIVNIEGTLSVNSFEQINAITSAGRTYVVTGVLEVRDTLTLRLPASTNPSYDARITTPGSGVLRLSPQTAGIDKHLNFGVASAGTLPRMVFIAELGKTVEASYSYTINLASSVNPRLITGLSLITEGVPLSLALPQDTRFEETLAVGDDTTLNINGFTVTLRGAFLAEPDAIIDYTGAALLRWNPVAGSYAHSFPSTRIPSSRFLSLTHSFTTDIIAENIELRGASVDLNGVTLDATYIEISSGSDLQNLSGATFNCETWFAQGDVGLDAPATWYLNATDAATAVNSLVQNSDASGGVTAEGIESEDLGGNINWTFGGVPLDGAAEDGNRLGLGLGTQHA